MLAIGLVAGDCIHGEHSGHPPHREPEQAIVVPQVVQITTRAMTSAVSGAYGFGNLTNSTT